VVSSEQLLRVSFILFLLLLFFIFVLAHQHGVQQLITLVTDRTPPIGQAQPEI
jgi:uncharacterized membrane protein